jgi:hypothetical protein
MTMTTGAVIGAIAPSEIYQSIVQKARSLAVKDPAFRPPSEVQDIMNSVFIIAAKPVVNVVHRIATKDIIEGLNAT